jgi:hypothetical protein
VISLALNGDDERDVLWLRERGGLAGLYPMLGGHTLAASLVGLPNASEALSMAMTGGAVAAYRDVIDDRTAARVELTLTPESAEGAVQVGEALQVLPHKLSAQLRTDVAVGFRFRVQDADGALFDGPQLTVPAGGFGPVVAEGVGEWQQDGLPPKAPVTVWLVFGAAQSQGSLEGAVHVDDVTATRPGYWGWLLDDFEGATPKHSFSAATALAATDADGDGVDDVMVLGAGAAAWLRSAPLTFEGALEPVWQPTSAPLPANTAPTSAALFGDWDRDGRTDALVVSSAGQDRLLRGDGFGQWVDGTLGGLPVDWADGRHARSADLNGDGVDDAVIGNRAGSDRLYLSHPDGHLTDWTPNLGFDDQDTAAVVLADLDGDGRADVVSLPASGNLPAVVRLQVDP